MSNVRSHVPAVNLFHRCSLVTAYRVAYSRQIWSKDGAGQANFHWRRDGGSSEVQSEITLEFAWGGAISRDQRDFRAGANTLIEVMLSSDAEQPWTLALLPGTDQHLSLVGMSFLDFKPDEKNAGFLASLLPSALTGQPKIVVPHLKERKSMKCPAPPTRWQRIVGG